MKKLFQKIIGFSFIFVGFNLVLAFALSLIINRNECIFKLDESKTILIMGSSLTELALNDKIIPGSVNISQGGESYYYTYLKLRKLLRNNSQIKTVILDYSGLGEYDEDNFFDDKYLLNKFPRYFYLMDIQEIYNLFIVNPIAVGRALFYIPIRFGIIILNTGFNKISYNNLDIGGHLYIKANEVENARKNYFNRNEQEKSQDTNFSEIQIKYLQKCYDLSNENNIKLILFLHPVDVVLKERSRLSRPLYYDYYRKNLNNAELLDYSDFFLDDSCKADIQHLNYKGAKLISEEIKNKLNL